MSHIPDDELLLYAYGELPAGRAAVESHLAACDECAARLRRLEESGVAVDLGLARPARYRARRLTWLALAAAAGVTALLLRPGTRAAEPERPAWQSHLVGSPYAGYVTGGLDFLTMDSQLVRLEQRRLRGTPQD